MHELSIAESLLRLAEEHAPAGSRVRIIRISAGPLRAIDPQALQWAWQSIIIEHAWHEARLEINFLPWHMHCPRCGLEWLAPDCSHCCACGARDAYPVGGNELTLDSIEIEEATTTQPEACHENPHR
jgi:Zn finger protein HypA/HybF involved in hydrogenase expression